MSLLQSLNLYLKNDSSNIFWFISRRQNVIIIEIENERLSFITIITSLSLCVCVCVLWLNGCARTMASHAPGKMIKHQYFYKQ